MNPESGSDMPGHVSQWRVVSLLRVARDCLYNGCRHGLCQGPERFPGRFGLAGVESQPGDFASVPDTIRALPHRRSRCASGVWGVSKIATGEKVTKKMEFY